MLHLVVCFFLVKANDCSVFLGYFSVVDYGFCEFYLVEDGAFGNEACLVCMNHCLNVIH